MFPLRTPVPFCSRVARVQIEEQRAYFRAVKEFQLACDKNEQLLATAQAMQQA